MPIDRALLKRHGVSAAAYKKIFTQDLEDFSKPQRRLVDLIKARIYDGRTLGLQQWRAIHAIDLAYEVPFNQTTPTLVQHLLSKELKPEQVLSELRDYGLSRDTLFMEVPIEGGGRQLVLNPPVFFQIFIPLVKAYTTMRLANLFNQRNTNPLLLYKPLKMSDHDQVSCEIVSDMINTTAIQYGYPAVLRQAISQMLRYGVMLSFPREEWDCQRQLVTGEGRDKNGNPVERETIIREGIRYFVPHPTRMFFDLKHPLTSLNTDTGTEFLGAWNVLSYGEILDNPLFYNRDKIFCGTNWFQMPAIGNYFQEVYPCNAKFPSVPWGTVTREDTAAWYSSGDRDQIVFVTQYFQKLIPKQFGLADYKYPLWHRFTVAGDDTVIWCEPCAYVPSWFMGWDYDENASKTSSMALECIPWQDHLGNILSQMLLTAKQNLTNVVFYDNQQIDKTDIERMRNQGESKYKSTIYIGFDSFKARVAQHAPQNAFHQPQFQKQSIQELLQLIPSCLQIMERVLQITAQEAGAAASHQQSKEEVKMTGAASGARVQFTMSYVDEGIDAWKRQQFEANMAYRDSTIEAQVPADIPNLEHVLKDLGFVITKKGNDMVIVRGKKSSIKLESFARNGEGEPLAGDKEVAASIFSLVQTICGQEQLFSKVGAKTLLTLLEWGAKLSGAPNDLRLRVLSDEDQKKDERPPENVLEAIKAAQTALGQQIEEKAIKPIAGEVAQDKQRIDQLEQVVQQLQKIYQVAAQTQDKNNLKAQSTAADIKRRDAAFQREQARKDAALKAEQDRKNAELSAELQRKEIEARASVEIKKQTAEATAKVGAAKGE